MSAARQGKNWLAYGLKGYFNYLDFSRKSELTPRIASFTDLWGQAVCTRQGKEKEGRGEREKREWTKRQVSRETKREAWRKKKTEWKDMHHSKKGYPKVQVCSVLFLLWKDWSLVSLSTHAQKPSLSCISFFPPSPTSVEFCCNKQNLEALCVL